jgi:hypothetical protein
MNLLAQLRQIRAWTSGIVESDSCGRDQEKSNRRQRRQYPPAAGHTDTVHGSNLSTCLFACPTDELYFAFCSSWRWVRFARCAGHEPVIAKCIASLMCGMLLLRSLKGLWVVQIEDGAFFFSGDFQYIVFTRPDNLARANVGRCGQQFRVQVGMK